MMKSYVSDMVLIRTSTNSKIMGGVKELLARCTLLFGKGLLGNVLPRKVRLRSYTPEHRHMISPITV
jgi:hypothetical protein